MASACCRRSLGHANACGARDRAMAAQRSLTFCAPGLESYPFKQRSCYRSPETPLPRTFMPSIAKTTIRITLLLRSQRSHCCQYQRKSFRIGKCHQGANDKRTQGSGLTNRGESFRHRRVGPSSGRVRHRRTAVHSNRRPTANYNQWTNGDAARPPWPSFSMRRIATRSQRPAPQASR